VDFIDEGVKRGAGVLLCELGDVRVACGGGGAGVAEQVLDMA